MEWKCFQKNVIGFTHVRKKKKVTKLEKFHTQSSNFLHYFKPKLKILILHNFVIQGFKTTRSRTFNFSKRCCAFNDWFCRKLLIPMSKWIQEMHQCEPYRHKHVRESQFLKVALGLFEWGKVIKGFERLHREWWMCLVCRGVVFFSKMRYWWIRSWISSFLQQRLITIVLETLLRN